MEFTKEAWENAQEGARLEWLWGENSWREVSFIGFMKDGTPVIEDCNAALAAHVNCLRIILPKRKVTVQLWRRLDGKLFTSTPETLRHVPCDWVLLGEHIFEIEEK